MTRKISALGLILILLFNTTVLGAQVQEVSLKVSYNIPTDSIDIALTAPKAERANVVITNQEDSFVIGQTEFALLKELSKGTDGKFSYSTAMPSASGSGKYYVTVTTDDGTVSKGSFWYMSEVQATTALSSVSSATEASFPGLINTNHADMGIDVDVFNAKSAAITSAFFKVKPAGALSKKSFLTAYAYAQLFGMAKGETNQSEVKRLFEEQASCVGYDLSAFNALDEDGKNWVLDKLASDSYKNGEPAKLLSQWICLAEINTTSVDTVENFKNLLFTKYASVVELDLSDEKSYNASSRKDNIMLDFINKRTFSDMNALKDAFKTAVDVYKPKDGGSGGSSGGSGSGGYSANTKFETGNDGSSVFSDVPTTHWAYNQINNLYKKGIVAGKETGKFHPEDCVTRAEFAKIISMAFFGNASVTDTNYSDVNKSAWYYEHIARLSELGIILGDDNGRFNPDARITRQDAAVIIRRVTQNRGKELAITRTYQGFKDDDLIASYAKESIIALYEAGKINGTGAAEFAPINNLTRAQAVQLVYAVME